MHRPTELFHPGDQRTGRPHPTPSGTAGRLSRAEACGTRLSLLERSPVFGCLALSQDSRADHGPPDGHDRVLAGLCSLGIAHPAGTPSLAGHLPEPERPTDTPPHRPLGVPVL